MKFKFEIGDLLKIPNILCYLRIIMVPLFLYVYLTAESPRDYFLAAGVVLLSGLTDFLDGQIARRCNMITDLGKIIDPLADKLMQLGMLVALTVKIKYMYLLVIYLVVKELVMLLAGCIVMNTVHRRLNGAKWYGKVCTAMLYAVMLLLVMFPGMNQLLQSVMLIVSAVALTISFYMYMRLYVIMMIDGRTGREDKILY
jgi:cardiolipin synthase